MSTKPTLIDKEVFCKRNNTTGKVVAQDELTVTICTDGQNKTVTTGTFQRWYTVQEDKAADTEQNEESKTGETQYTFSENPTPPQPEKPAKEAKPAGVVGIGTQLRDKFIEILKEQANQDLDITVDEEAHRDIIKYNGKNVFECSTAKRRFNVLAHPDSLTPLNLQKVTMLFPKEWGWSLRAKFIFTELTEWPLMKTIIVDGLYYRQKEEKANG